MPVGSKINKIRKRARNSRTGHEGRAHPHDFHASVRESVNLTPLPGPSGVAEASEATDRNFEVVMNFPASTQDSIVLEPLQGEMIDNFQGDAAASSPVALTAREMRRAGLTDEARWEKAAAREAMANEPSSRSSSSDDSSRSSGSTASQPSRSSLIGLGDGGESARRTTGVS